MLRVGTTNADREEEGSELDVIFIERDVRLAVFLEALDVFSDVHHSSERAGARLTVTWRYGSTLIKNSDLTSFTRDIIPHFAKPRNICRAGMLHYLANVSNLGHNMQLGLTVSQTRFT